MSLTNEDVRSMNQSFGSLADTLLRNRQMKEQKSEFDQDLGLREQELAQRQTAQAPETQIANDQAKIADDAVKKLGISKISSSWQTADGQQIDLTGTPDEIKAAAAQNPPAPQSKVTSRFITKDGVEHVIAGTPAQLKAQQDTVTQQGGGIQTGGFDSWTDPQSGQTFPVYTDRKGGAHVIREQPDGTITTETGTKDPITGAINTTTVRTPSRNGQQAPDKAAGGIPDQSAPSKNGGPAKKWRYYGQAKTLNEAKADSDNWKPVQ